MSANIKNRYLLGKKGVFNISENMGLTTHQVKHA